MPIFEYRCPDGHITERLFLSRAEADNTDEIQCPAPVQEYETGDTIPCGAGATKITSAGAFILGGSPGGWEKPSPTAKRTVNPDSVSFTGDSDYFK